MPVAWRQSSAPGSGPGRRNNDVRGQRDQCVGGSPSASSSFSATDAAVIFVVAIVSLLLAVALIGRRTPAAGRRPRLRTMHSRRVRQAAEEDVAEIERNARLYGRPVSGARRREEEDDDL